MSDSKSILEDFYPQIRRNHGWDRFSRHHVGKSPIFPNEDVWDSAGCRVLSGIKITSVRSGLTSFSRSSNLTSWTHGLIPSGIAFFLTVKASSTFALPKRHTGCIGLIKTRIELIIHPRVILEEVIIIYSYKVKSSKGLVA
jgi:hypothetical protein